jgi:hypothetical protein
MKLILKQDVECLVLLTTSLLLSPVMDVTFDSTRKKLLVHPGAKSNWLNQEATYKEVSVSAAQSKQIN